MKKNTILYILIAFLVIANVFFLVNHLGHSKGEKGGSPGDFVATELKFDDAQMEKFNVINDQHEVEIKAILKDIKKLKGSLFTQISEVNSSKETIDSITGLIGKHVTEKDAKTYYHFKKIQEICTDEQKERFNKIVKQALRQTGGRRPPPKK